MRPDKSEDRFEKFMLILELLEVIGLLAVVWYTALTA